MVIGFERGEVFEKVVDQEAVDGVIVVDCFCYVTGTVLSVTLLMAFN